MRRVFINIVLVSCFLTSTTAAQERDYFLPLPTTQKYALILAGATIDETYEEQIDQWAFLLHDILVKDYRYQSDQIILLMNKTDFEDERISGTSSGERIRAELRALKELVNPSDQVFIFLLGHSTSNEEGAKFVITGVDITAREVAEMLETFSEQDIVLVNTTSSSYPFSTFLSGPGRVIVSATSSRAEKYNTLFAHYFIAALDGHAGDRDKNQRVSIWEAYNFASKSVEKWYADRSHIPTEHAVLDDNGDGIFSGEPDPVASDGRLAQIAYLDSIPHRHPEEEGLSSEEIIKLRELTAHVRELERSVFLLRNRKEEISQETYQRKMEALLIELATVSRKLRNKTVTLNE